MPRRKRAPAGGPFIFPWSNDPSCTGDYADIFEPTPGLVLQPVSLPGDIMIETGWEPLGIYERFKEALKLDLSLADFCADLVAELRSLPFRADLTAAARAWRASAGAASLIGVHIRRTDRTEHHRQQFRAFLRGEQGLNRELPIYLNAVYGLCPNSVIWAHENMTLTRALRRYKSASGAISYTVFSDDIGETRKFQKAAAFGGVGRERCVSGTSAPRSPQAAHGFRNTALKDAALDLLRLCECDAIAQSNRASTFSLAASIIGGKPIITAKTRYPFWRVIEEKISASPSDVRLPRRAA